MATYQEKSNFTLLTGSNDPDGDTISVRRINGTQISSWPATVNLTTGTASVAETGAVTFDDGGSTAGHPTGGQSLSNGSFTFTLWDGSAESSVYTATITLEGLNTAPSGQNQTLIFEV